MVFDPFFPTGIMRYRTGTDRGKLVIFRKKNRLITPSRILINPKVKIFIAYKIYYKLKQLNKLFIFSVFSFKSWDKYLMSHYKVEIREIDNSV